MAISGLPILNFVSIFRFSKLSPFPPLALIKKKIWSPMQRTPLYTALHSVYIYVSSRPLLCRSNTFISSLTFLFTSKFVVLLGTAAQMSGGKLHVNTQRSRKLGNLPIFYVQCIHILQCVHVTLAGIYYLSWRIQYSKSLTVPSALQTLYRVGFWFQVKKKRHVHWPLSFLPSGIRFLHKDEMKITMPMGPTRWPSTKPGAYIWFRLFTQGVKGCFFFF